MTKPDVVVTNDETQHRYVATIEGLSAGFAAYELRGNQVIFTHTVVEPMWEGKGVGGALAAGALDDVVSLDKQIVPVCPFIVSYIKLHQSYLPHVDASYRAAVTP